MGPSLTFTDPWNLSPSTDVTVAPGKHSATVAMSLKCAQASSIGTGTENRWVRSMPTFLDLRPRCCDDRPPGQHGGEVLAVVRRPVEVRRRVGAGRGPFGS